jgi:diaminohydroxyphosphoribosylaminopyrimidine deaminase/5-amino-6-(5-phosphoribosylamino)uracil reductase
LYVTLEPCCTQGRTPPCTDSILAAGIKKVVTGASDPNPRHCGRGLAILEKGGVEVVSGVLGEECERLNEAFSHWIVHRSPWVTVKSAMTLDGKIATAAGESKWITGERARAYGMRLRQETDAILVGINTILADDPSLTFRPSSPRRSGTGLKPVPPERGATNRRRRIILDARGRTPLTAKVVSDSHAGLTTIVLSKLAPQGKRNALSKKVQVLVAPLIEAGRSGKEPRLDLRWVLKELGSQQVTSLIVEGGGEVNASFLLQGLAHRVACFYAPMVLGGRDARPAVGGQGATRLEEAVTLTDVRWRRLGPDWLLTARVER